ncbi:DNA-processing protein DprA [Anaerotardibacter muris]|uniref:DNA-processing protein DprA n=1 Tax=Anaerotardibacter muris TaxID=2941505 RepID=UPI00203E0E73|nr:DNA-processing protein DprA [Anaerotardibacter muris]
MRELRPTQPLEGERFVLSYGREGYPEQLMNIPDPPSKLYGIGDPSVLDLGLAIIGARRATPYGRTVAEKFSKAAAEHGITIISGGALGCDSAAHRGCLSVGGKTVVVLGGGCDLIYPESNRDLFQEVVDKGGAVISERQWQFPPLPYTFRARNRIIAGLARATLIVEAGLPSGTFSTADDALSANRDVLVVPGAITSPHSRGANRLLYQGATPVIDDETFEDMLVDLFGCMKIQDMRKQAATENSPLYAALQAEALTVDALMKRETIVNPKDRDRLSWIMVELAKLEHEGFIERFPNGSYGAVVV